LPLPLLSLLAQASPLQASAGRAFRGKRPMKADHTATLDCDDGNGNIVFSKEMEFTDFPLEQITCRDAKLL
jgi:hypothetical protein